MREVKIQSLTLTDRNGKQKKILQPWFGKLILTTEGGKTMIVKHTIFGPTKIIIPSSEDRVEVECR